MQQNIVVRQKSTSTPLYSTYHTKYDTQKPCDNNPWKIKENIPRNPSRHRHAQDITIIRLVPISNGQNLFRSIKKTSNRRKEHQPLQWFDTSSRYVYSITYSTAQHTQSCPTNERTLWWITGWRHNIWLCRVKAMDYSDDIGSISSAYLARVCCSDLRRRNLSHAIPYAWRRRTTVLVT